jgi:hypothetical protein
LLVTAKRSQPTAATEYSRSAAWKPPYTGDWCRYATDWATSKKKWSLTITQAEYNAPASERTTC